MEIKIMYILLYTDRKNSGSRISEDERGKDGSQKCKQICHVETSIVSKTQAKS